MGEPAPCGGGGKAGVGVKRSGLRPRGAAHPRATVSVSSLSGLSFNLVQSSHSLVFNVISLCSGELYQLVLSAVYATWDPYRAEERTTQKWLREPASSR